jgi:PAS domain S-box-containing protein
MPGREWIQRAGPFIAVALAAAGGLIFETITPEIISATLFYVVVVLVGYWFPQPKAALALALLATPLIIIGDLISIPNGPSDWKAWLNRGLAVGVVWLAAVFVWYIRVLEQKLQAGKGCLQFALDAVRLGWGQYDPRRRVASVDPRFKEIFDIIADELPIEGVKKLVDPDDGERFWVDLAAALDPTDPNSSAHEYRVRSRRGGLHWVEVRWLAHFEDAGSLKRLASAVGTVQDITERKGAEERMRDSEERLRAIYDGTYQYIGLLSPDGTLLDANRASLEFVDPDAFGSKREHVVGRPFWETVWFINTPGAPEKLREAIARAAAGEFIRYEVSIKRPSGEEVTFDFSLHPVRNQQGDVSLIVPEGRNITDRKCAEEELAKSEERMRFIADRAQIGYWDWQIAADRVEWSPLVNQLLGVPPNGPMNYAHFLAALHPDDRERTDHAVHACLDSMGQKDYDVEFRTLLPEETVRWLRAKGNAAFADGKPVRMAGLVLDVTERKQHEDRERLLVREMNHRVKNILAVVDAIAHRTTAESPEDFAGRFSERIRALSANQDLLFRNDWKGVDVEELVRAQLSHFVDLIGSRIVLDGPKLRFNTAGAQAIGLALHELATNAGKYGALSTNRGRVGLRWNFSDNTFTMSWTEREGPSVSAPKRRGFGTTVVERMAKSSLGGTVDLDYAPSGLTWCLTCPSENALERRI